MSTIMLGNLSLDEMEKRTQVEWPRELKDFLKPRHQASASAIQPGKWHCFDRPFTIVCGDMDVAKELLRHLKPLGHNFAEPLQVSLQRSH